MTREKRLILNRFSEKQLSRYCKRALQSASEQVFYGHQCDICRQVWSSPERAAECPDCGHWHINHFGSFFLRTNDGK